MKIKIATLKSIPFAGVSPKDLLWTGALTTVAVIAPGILAHTPHNQWVTGTIVNTLLFIASWRIGLANALLVAVLPSSVALMRGLLPAPMALLIPYIIFSNALMIVVFSFFKNRMLAGIFTASLIKSGFLFFVSMLFAAKIASPFIVMLQLPQLITALAGGFLAVGIISSIKKLPSKNSSQKI